MHSRPSCVLDAWSDCCCELGTDAELDTRARHGETERRRPGEMGIRREKSEIRGQTTDDSKLIILNFLNPKSEIVNALCTMLYAQVSWPLYFKNCHEPCALTPICLLLEAEFYSSTCMSQIAS
jgi:hypothetical protein